MCYSKEVSLAVGSAIASGSAYTWWKYCLYRVRSGLRNAARKTALVPFYRWVVLAYLCIGGHQLMEFLAIYTGNQIVYKLGLIISISFMYFIMRSLEELTKIRFGSRIFVILIALTGLEMFTRTMTFENMHFWVRGDSHVLWGAMWIILFLYWNFCILYARKLTTSTINRRLLLWYSFLSIGASFLLSLAYGYIATLSQRLVNTSELSALGCFDALKDSPSIWCTFALVHIFLIPLLFSLMEKHYQVDIPYEKREISWQSKLVMAILAAGVLFFLALTVPLFFTISIKMVTK